MKNQNSKNITSATTREKTKVTMKNLYRDRATKLTSASLSFLFPSCGFIRSNTLRYINEAVST